MATWQRIGVALFWTLGLMVGGLFYNEVFVQGLLPIVDTDGLFATPVVWLNRIVPVVLVILLLAVWAWVIAGAIQDERTVDRRRVRR
jgi:hypothetical protein